MCIKSIGTKFMFLTLGVDRRLAGKLFQHLRRARQPVPRLSDGAVKHQLVDLEVPHRVGLGLGLSGSRGGGCKMREMGGKLKHSGCRIIRYIVRRGDGVDNVKKASQYLHLPLPGRDSGRGYTLRLPWA